MSRINLEGLAVALSTALPLLVYHEPLHARCLRDGRRSHGDLRWRRAWQDMCATWLRQYALAIKFGWTEAAAVYLRDAKTISVAMQTIELEML